MDGYVALVYSGTVLPEPEEVASASLSKNADGESAAGQSESSSSRSVFDSLVSPPANPGAPESVRDSYLDKGAQVLVLDTKHSSVYEDGMIVKRGSKRIGVFSVDVPLSEEAAQERLDYFKEAKVDVVVCIASVRSYVRNATGIDVVVTLQDDVSTMGTNANGTFYVNAPSIDSVGAVLLSPNNVVSAKVVDSL